MMKNKESDVTTRIRVELLALGIVVITGLLAGATTAQDDVGDFCCEWADEECVVGPRRCIDFFQGDELIARCSQGASWDCEQ